MEAVAQEFAVGLKYTSSKIVDDKMVRGYADLIGDHNPIHVDDAFAKKTKFGQRIAHGGILFGVISKILGMDMPGNGTVFLSQTVNFRAPVFINDTVTVEDDYGTSSKKRSQDQYRDQEADRTDRHGW